MKGFLAKDENPVEQPEDDNYVHFKRGNRRIRQQNHVKEIDQPRYADPVVRARIAFSEIAGIDGNESYEVQKETINVLIDLLMDDEQLRDLVLGALEPYLQSHSESTQGEELTPEIVQNGFAALSESYENAKPGSAGRRPERVERIYAVFSGRELDAVPLEDFVAVMPETVKSPREQVPSDIAKINSDFRRFDIPLLIEGKSYGRQSDRKTFYRVLCRQER